METELAKQAKAEADLDLQRPVNLREVMRARKESRMERMSLQEIAKTDATEKGDLARAALAAERAGRIEKLKARLSLTELRSRVATILGLDSTTPAQPVAASPSTETAPAPPAAHAHTDGRPMTSDERKSLAYQSLLDQAGKANAAPLPPTAPNVISRAQFDMLGHAERNAFFRSGGKLKPQTDDEIRTEREAQQEASDLRMRQAEASYLIKKAGFAVVDASSLKVTESGLAKVRSAVAHAHGAKFDRADLISALNSKG